MADEAHGIVVAKAAIDRILEYEKSNNISTSPIQTCLEASQWMVLPLSLFPSAPAQGAIGIEVANNNSLLIDLVHSINDETGDRTLATSGSSKLIAGENKIVEELLGLNFEISMKSFFQTNPKSAEKLYLKVLDYALENKESIDNSIVMDLFCGTGTIGQILASKSTNTKIIGVDIVASAIKDAEKNAKRNNIAGLKFYTADVGKFLYEHPEYKNKIRTIILDPSRAGIAPKTLQKIIAINADRMVYVSCNPATQARDTIELINSGYEIKKISLVDQFPHTSHIETVVLFEKNNI